MAAARGRSGTGTIVALVVFIVLAFGGIGMSIWLYQQNTIIQQAARANQQYYEREVASIFEEQEWPLDTAVDATYGFRYGEEAYSQTGEKLQDAVLLQEMRPVLGWNTPESITEKLQESPAQQDLTETYDSLRGLLGYYEQEYQRLRQRTQELKGNLESTEKQLADKSEAMNQMQNSLMKEKNEAIAQHKKDMEDLRNQYNEMKQMYQETQQKLQDWQKKFDQAQQEWENRLAEAKNEAQDWKQLYQRATAEDQEVEKLVSAGRVLSVEPRHEFVVLEGGSDEDWEKNQRFVIYTESPAGVRTMKGQVVINNVYDTTSLATILSQQEQLMDGDMFVQQKTWNKFQGREQMAERPAEEKQPATEEVQPEEEPATEAAEEEAAAEEEEPAAETEEEAAAEEEEPAEEEEEDGEEFIFEF